MAIVFAEVKGADGEVGEPGIDTVGDVGADAATLLDDKERFTLSVLGKLLLVSPLS